MNNTESEADFQSWVIDVARTFGWKVAHTRPTPTGRVDKQGMAIWTTPTDPGFPDWVFARRGRLLVPELKTEKGIVSSAQWEWIDALGEYGRVWRPSQRDEIEAELK